MLSKYKAKATPGATTRYMSLGGKSPSRRNLSSSPVIAHVTSQKIAARNLGWHNLEMATRALHRDGLVVLQDVIGHSKLDALNSTMIRDAYKLQALGDDGPFNYNKGYAASDQLGWCL